jgi:hypothetical protein
MLWSALYKKSIRYLAIKSIIRNQIKCADTIWLFYYITPFFEFRLFQAKQSFPYTFQASKIQRLFC